MDQNKAKGNKVLFYLYLFVFIFHLFLYLFLRGTDSASFYSATRVWKAVFEQ